MVEFRDRKDRERFERVEEEGIAFATYRDLPGVRAILHVETPAHMRGRGVAEKLMDDIVAWARGEHVKLMPRCSYAAHYFEAKPDARDVLA